MRCDACLRSSCLMCVHTNGPELQVQEHTHAHTHTNGHAYAHFSINHDERLADGQNFDDHFAACPNLRSENDTATHICLNAGLCVADVLNAIYLDKSDRILHDTATAMTTT